MRRSWRRDRREWLWFLALAGPNLILFAAFTFWPILYSFYLSLTDWNLISPQVKLTGVTNYVDLLFDSWFWRVLLNTVVYALCVVLFAQILAFFLALLLNRRTLGRPLLRTIAFTPYVVTPAAAAIVWVLLLDPRMGPLSTLYDGLGVQGPNWLSSVTLALGAVILVGLWKEIGIATVFFLAGLQGLPVDCYEAARLETHSRWAVLRHVTLPLMSPVIFFLLITGFIAATKAFDAVAIMTEGGPVYPASSTYVYHLYRLAFRDFQAGYASAVAVVFLMLTLTFTALQFRAARRWVHHGE
jgi:sn-glycerol 3-phosphate transport system permease protein